jgi:hypothetical protein
LAEISSQGKPLAARCPEEQPSAAKGKQRQLMTVIVSHRMPTQQAAFICSYQYQGKRVFFVKIDLPIKLIGSRFAS